MKNGIHPDYNPVVFVDANTGKEFITRSTKSSAEKKVIDGVEYGVVTLENHERHSSVLDWQATPRGYRWSY